MGVADALRPACRVVSSVRMVVWCADGGRFGARRGCVTAAEVTVPSAVGVGGSFLRRVAVVVVWLVAVHGRSGRMTSTEKNRPCRGADAQHAAHHAPQPELLTAGVRVAVCARAYTWIPCVHGLDGSHPTHPIVASVYEVVRVLPLAVVVALLVVAAPLLSGVPLPVPLPAVLDSFSRIPLHPLPLAHILHCCVDDPTTTILPH